MKTDVESVAPPSSIQKAAMLMRVQNVGFLPVCEDGLRIVGTVTDRDIAIRAVAEGLPASTSVSDLMSRDIVACHVDDDLDQARILMAQHRKSRIVCVNRDGRLAGVISLSDIAQLDEASGLETLRSVCSREGRDEARYVA
jgi:CBS domain-containing protein